jgi:hypothetical protein
LDVNDLARIGLHLETQRKFHPPKPVKMTVLFPFEIRKARWKIDDGPDGYRFVCDQVRGKESFFGLGVPIDPWQVRKEFLDLRTEVGLLTFLNRYGQWDDSEVPQTLEEFWEVQAAIGQLLDFPQGVRRFAQQHGWNREFTCSLHWQNPGSGLRPRCDTGRLASAVWRVKCCSIMDALIASVEIDLVRGVRDRECKRRDCRRRFVPKTKRQQYCTQYCSHLVSIRRSRRIANAKKWKSEGMSLTQIARRLGTNRQTVKRILKWHSSA